MSTASLERLCAGPRCPASSAPELVPGGSGYYAIYVDDASALPAPYSDVPACRGTRLLYLGIATKSLLRRLVEEDLRHQRPSTFFRGIGAIMGYRPPIGSLAGKSNQNNHRFSASDTGLAVDWINDHLSVNWIEESRAVAATEKALIRAHRPLLNTKHNPDALASLATLRLECRAVARAHCALA